MKFLNPSGLWLLLGVPVLIIIYIIKAQHEDLPVSSTYIWKLSEKYLKKHLPVQKMRKILLFLLQLMMILLTAFFVSRPAVVSGECTQYIAIIDSSCSMNIKDSHGVSRFERALEDAEELSDVINDGHTFSVISAGQDAVTLVRNSSSVNEVHLTLSNMECGKGTFNIDKAFSEAQMLAVESNHVKVYLFTDKDYDDVQNTEIKNYSDGEFNISVLSLIEDKPEDSFIFTSEILCAGDGREVSVGLKVDGRTVEAKKIKFGKDDTEEVVFDGEVIKKFTSAEVYIDIEDGLDLDNSYRIIRNKEEDYSVLLVSDKPLYLESAFGVFEKCSLNVTSYYSEDDDGKYDLYVFDHKYPKNYPSSGSVLQFGTGLLPEGLEKGGKSENPVVLSAPEEVSDFASKLLTSMKLTDINVEYYDILNISSMWQSVLCAGNETVAATKDKGRGLRDTVVSFDLHDSNLPLLTDYIRFLSNVVKYSFPYLVERSDYEIGEDIVLTCLPGAEELYMIFPDKSTKEYPVNINYYVVSPDSVGTYTAFCTAEGNNRLMDFFVHIPFEEVIISDAENTLPSEIYDTPAEELSEDAMSEIWFWIALAVLVILLTEWGIYYYEQY